MIGRSIPRKVSGKIIVENVEKINEKLPSTGFQNCLPELYLRACKFSALELTRKVIFKSFPSQFQSCKIEIRIRNQFELKDCPGGVALEEELL